MKIIKVEVNDSIYEHIIFFLKNLPKNLIHIETQDEIRKPLKNTPDSKAFGILKNKAKDPAKWQDELRDDRDRDIV